MKSFIIGIVQIVVASVIINFLYNLPNTVVEDLSYQKYSPPVVITARPLTTLVPTTVPVSDIMISTKIGFIWETLALCAQYQSNDYSSAFRDKMRTENNPGWLEKGDRYRLLETAFPYAKIEIVEKDIDKKISTIGKLTWHKELRTGWIAF